MNDAHKWLREGTADCHARVDAAFGGFDLSTRPGYCAFLTAQARAFLPMEAALDAAGAERIVPDWPSRKRSAALIADLESSKVHIPAPVTLPRLENDAAIWGQLYVLEGSRLGGRMLKKFVPPELPRAFLDHALPPSAWRELLDRIDEHLTSVDARESALSAARAAFAVFEAAAGAGTTMRE